MTETDLMSSSRQPKTRLSSVAWMVVVFSIAFRLIVQYLKSDNLHTDPDAYVMSSQSIAAGTGFSTVGTSVPTAFRPPLFPMLLAVPQWLGLSTVLSIAIVQLIASAFLLIATFRLAVLMGLNQRYATIAVCVVSCDPLLLVYSSLPMTEVPATAFLTWAAVFVLQLWQRLSVDSLHRTVVAGIFAGCCFGFGGLCRPILFVACATVSIFLFVAAVFRTTSFYLSTSNEQLRKLRFRAGSEHEQQIAHAAERDQLTSAIEKPSTFLEDRRQNAFATLSGVSVPAIVAALVLCPWIVRNAIYFEQFIPATTHGGYTLLLGNNPVFYSEVVNQTNQPRWDGSSLNRWTLQLDSEMNAAGIRPTDEVGRDRWMYSRAQANMKADPASYRKACLLRLKRFWAIVPTSAAENGTVAVLAVGMFYSAIALGLLVQLVLNLKNLFVASGDRDSNRTIQPWILWSCIFAFVAMHCVYWTNTRMRAPLMPIVIVLSLLSYSKVFCWFDPRKNASSVSSAPLPEIPSSQQAVSGRASL